MRRIAFALGLVLIAAPPASAGILDSIKGLFSGGVSSLFGGSSNANANANASASGASGNSNSSAQGTDINTLLSQVQTSQKDVASKESDLASTYNGSISGIKANDPALQSKLDALNSSSSSNDQLYLRLLQAKADLTQSNPSALSAVSTQMSQVTSTQEALESNYQRIQSANQQAGFFTPGGKASDIAASGGALPAVIWADPKAQGYIDEWLTGCHLNQYGQWEGNTGVSTVTSGGMPDSFVGKSRYQGVWEMLANDTAGSNITLSDYVTQKMQGGSPTINYTPPKTVVPTVAAASETAPVQVEQVQTPTAVPSVAAAASSTNPGVTDQDVADVDTQLKSHYDDLMNLQKQGQGTSDQAKALLQQIGDLQTKRTGLVQQLGH